MKILLFFLALSLGITSQNPLHSETKSKNNEKPSVKNIKSIQAFTDFCFYGQKLTKIEITYFENVDLSEVTVETYVLLDRGYANPDFTKVTIEKTEINGQVVTLKITEDTEALDDNTFIYSGDNTEGARTKNPVGAYATGAWYRNIEGIIYFGKEHTDEYRANTSGDGYQTRKCLELKLYHRGENIQDAVCMANNDGTYNSNGLWKPAIDANYGKNGFQSFETLEIEVPTTATDGDKYVKGWAYFPPDFNKTNSKKYPLIVTISGYGTSYWKHEDGTNNFGTGLNFDGSGFTLDEFGRHCFEYSRQKSYRRH